MNNMTTQWMNLSLRAVGVILVSAGMVQTVGAEPVTVALPQSGVQMTNLQTEKMKLTYDEQTRRLGFDKVTNSKLALFDFCKAELKAGDSTTLLGVEAWESMAQTSAVDWVLMIDESKSMRRSGENRVYMREALDFALAMLSRMSEKDSLSVYLVSRDTKLLGSKVMGSDAAAREQLKKDLEELHKKAHQSSQSNFSNTGMLYRVREKVSEMNAAPRTGERVPAVVVLVDTDADASPAGTLDGLIADATQSGKEVPVSAVVFYNGANNGSYFEYDSLCSKTKGKFYGMNKTASASRLGKMCQEVTRTLHAPHCKFSLAMPADISQKNLQLTFHMKEAHEGPVQISFEPDALQKVCAGAPVPAEIGTAVSKTLEQIKKSAADVAALAAAEQAQPQDAAAVNAAAGKVREHANALLPLCKKLKEAELEKVKKAVALALRQSELSDEDRAVLNRIRTFVENSQLTAQNLQVVNMLELMGRSTPLPEEPATPQVDPNVTLVQSLITQIKDSAEDLAALKTSEEQENLDLAAIEQNLSKVKARVDAARPICVNIKKLSREDALAAARTVESAEGISPEDAQAVLCIMQFIVDSSVTAENISDPNILALLGRDTPLPNLEELAGTPARVYWTVGGGVGALILVLTLIYVAYVRRQKKKRLADMSEIGEVPMPAPLDPDYHKIVTCIKSTEPVPPGEHVRARLLRTDSNDCWLILGKLVSIGRGSDNDLQVKNDTISSRHCTLSFRHGVWNLVDLNSINGIYANGSLHKTLELTSGAEFELGDIKFRFIVEN